MQTQNSGSVASSTVWEEVKDTSVNTSSSSSNTIATVESASSHLLSYPTSMFKPLVYIQTLNKPNTFNEADAK